MDEEMKAHIERVGCRDAAAYREWCAANKLRDGLHKGPQEREREARRYDRLAGQEALKAARLLERRPEDVLRALFNGNAASLGVALERRPYLAQLGSLFRAAKNQSGAREAFLRLLLHTRRCKGFEDTSPVFDRLFGEGNTFAGGLLALARRSKQWIRPLEDWKPVSHNPRRQFGELARHLLCEYNPPAFLEAAWFRDGKEGADEQGWFIGVGWGKSLREIGLPLALTKRMAHVATTEIPASCTVVEGWRWAQIVGMGGSPRLAQTMIATPLGTTFREEDFWETVVRFFVDNPMLDVSRVGPLLDYLRYERCEPRPQELGAARERLPVGFTMKGRTPAALLARMEAWHRRLSVSARAAQEKWSPSGILGFPMEDAHDGQERSDRDADGTRWRITEITTAKALSAEGAAMQHCVATYAPSCVRGAVSVWAVTAQFRSTLNPVRVVTLAVNRNRAIIEARGRRNALPSAAPVSLALLPREESALLVRSRRIINQWASAERLTLPAYLR